MIDVLVIGAGPAGITAAIYAKRAGMDVMVVHYGNSNVEKSEKIDNYYGFENGIDGKTLYESGIRQALNLGVIVEEDEVFDINKENEAFRVDTERGSYEAKAVIIATGNKKLRPNIDGIEQFEGRGVSYCAICDGFFFRGKKVAVIGSGNFAMNEAHELSGIADSVRIFLNGENVPEKRDFEVVGDKIKSVYGDSRVQGIELENGERIDVDGIFIACGEAGCTDFARRLGIALNGDSIVVDDNMKTNISGLFACGNATGGLLQICKASYEGAKAGIEAANFIKSK